MATIFERWVDGIPPSIVVSSEEAAAAICELNGRVSGSPVKAGWFRRAAWTGYTAAMQLQGIEIDEIDVFSWGCGLQIPNRPHRLTVTDDFDSFDPWWHRLANHDRRAWREELPFTPQINKDLPRSYQALELVRQYALRSPTIEAWLELPRFIHGLGLSETPLPCLIAGAKTLRSRSSPPPETIRALFKGLTSAARRGTDTLIDMEATYRSAVRSIQAEYRPGKLPELLALSLAIGVLSPSGVASTLDVSIAGAGKLLERAEGLGLLIEVSGRKSWKSYLTPDLAVTFGFRRPSPGRPKKNLPATLADTDLNVAFDAFDRQLAELDVRLSKMSQIDNRREK